MPGLTVSAAADISSGMSDDLLKDIRRFLQKTGMSPSYFGKLAVNNSELVRRLEGGQTVTLPTDRRVRAFIRDYREKV